MGILLKHNKVQINHSTTSRHDHEIEATIDDVLSQTFSKELFPIYGDAFYVELDDEFIEGEFVYAKRK